MLPHETHCVALSRTFEIWTKKVWTTPPLQNSKQLIQSTLDLLDGAPASAGVGQGASTDQCTLVFLDSAQVGAGVGQRASSVFGGVSARVLCYLTESRHIAYAEQPPFHPPPRGFWFERSGVSPSFRCVFVTSL